RLEFEVDGIPPDTIESYLRLDPANRSGVIEIRLTIRDESGATLHDFGRQPWPNQVKVRQTEWASRNGEGLKLLCLGDDPQILLPMSFFPLGRKYRIEVMLLHTALERSFTALEEDVRNSVISKAATALQKSLVTAAKHD